MFYTKRNLVQWHPWDGYVPNQVVVGQVPQGTKVTLLWLSENVFCCVFKYAFQWKKENIIAMRKLAKEVKCVEGLPELTFIESVCGSTWPNLPILSHYSSTNPTIFPPLVYKLSSSVFTLEMTHMLKWTIYSSFVIPPFLTSSMSGSARIKVSVWSFWVQSQNYGKG